jgi:hypothetical protein
MFFTVLRLCTSNTGECDGTQHIRLEHGQTDDCVGLSDSMRHQKATLIPLAASVKLISAVMLS